MDTSKDIAKTTRGTLRLTMSRGANVVAVALMLAQFQSENPGTTLDILWIVREGFHAGIRLGDVLEQDMIAVQISEPLVPAFFASPGCLARRGRPRRPADLLDHCRIRYRQPSSGKIRAWWVKEGGREKRVDPPTRDSSPTMLSASSKLRGKATAWAGHRARRWKITSRRMISKPCSLPS